MFDLIDRKDLRAAAQVCWVTYTPLKAVQALLDIEAGVQAVAEGQMPAAITPLLSQEIVALPIAMFILSK
jgi:hypothetical protein